MKVIFLFVVWFLVIGIAFHYSLGHFVGYMSLYFEYGDGSVVSTLGNEIGQFYADKNFPFIFFFALVSSAVGVGLKVLPLTRGKGDGDD